MTSNESKSAPALCGIVNQFFQRIEHELDMLIVGVASSFKFGQLARQICVGRGHFTQAHKRAHDRDVHEHRAAALKDGREHRHAFLGKCVGRISPPTMTRT